MFALSLRRADPNMTGLRQGEHPEIWTQSWFERRRDSIANCGRMVTDSATVTMESLYIGNHHRSFEWCHRWPTVPTTTSPPPKRGFHVPPRYANGYMSATGDPIHFMFGSRVGFSGTADRMALFPVWANPRWRPPPCWKNFKWPYLWNRSSDIHFMFGSRWGFRGRQI